MRASAFPADEALLAFDPEVFVRIRQALPQADHVISAPEARTRQTANGLSSAVSIDSSLGDIDHGRWTGRRIVDVEREEPDGLMAWITDPDAAPHGGESVTQAVARIGGWLRGRMAVGGMTLAVTHPAIVRAAVVAVLQAPSGSFWRVDVQPLGLTEFTSDGRRWALRSFNRTAG